ncbi:tyrosine-type recombinase/integrase [Massilia arenae]|uniref:tyrosine-type recombinase/integrase n=1 Tax=Massilia arenae TaxID=2603288 RepID=UPI0028048DEA|nr:integrase arm-type DNA-binding domain-containing protein [Massilia arenae]
MSYTINKLSAIKVRAVMRPGLYGDGGGLWLQVSRSGSKSWIFRYDLAGRRREMGLGTCITVDLALARDKARACRLVLLDKRDPLEERDKARAEHVQRQAKRVSFGECAASYIDAHRGSWKSAKHAAQWKTTLAMYASPVIGSLPVADVDTDLLVKVLAPIWKTKTETATRLRGRIESVLDWAATRKLRHDVNPARWRGHLENLLANPNKIAPVKNHPALPWREVGGFMTQLRQREGVSARAIEFAILTACRSGEVRGATWDEFDLDAKLWAIPAERMKAGKEHRVPLSTSAIALLRAREPWALCFSGAGHEDHAVRHEPDGRPAANGAHRHHRSRLSFDLPRLVCGVGEQRLPTRGVRARAGAQAARQGGGGIPARGSVRQACGPDAGVGRLLRSRCGAQALMPRSRSMPVGGEVNRERATTIKRFAMAVRYALTDYLFL